MKIILVFFCLVVSIQSVKFTLAEINFLQGMIYDKSCSKEKLKVCIKAGTYYKKALNLNKNEFFYNFSLAALLLRLYTFTGNKKMLDTAINYCTRSTKHSWDKYKSNFCFADAYLKMGDKERALYELERAKYYLPHNAKLQGAINELLSRKKRH